VRRFWEFRASGLAGTERAALDTLFVATQGQLKTFTLLDPVSNLLSNSEDFQGTAWTADPLLQLVGGQTDPFGTFRATQINNPSSIDRSLVQLLPAPGNAQYTFSVWARSTDGSGLIQTARSGTAMSSERLKVASSWERFVFPVALGEDILGITFGFAIPAGASVYVFGAQVDPHVGSSDYKQTQASNGVVTSVRFASDQLTFRAQGEDVFDTLIQLVSVGS
jgi:hypothetical protein